MASGWRGAFTPQQQPLADPYGNVEPLEFDWQKKPGDVFHPSKAPYNPRHGVHSIPTSRLIKIDHTYLDNITARKDVMSHHPDTVLGVIDNTKGCVEEMYRWLTKVYLPRRFPSIFQLQGISGTATSLRNLVDGQIYPLKPPANQIETLKILGSLVDEDYLFFLPSVDGNGHVLAAYLDCHANGPGPKNLLGRNLRDTQEVVALGSITLLENMEVGKIGILSTWTITDDNRMFVAGSHNPLASASSGDAKQLYVTSQRQTMRKLPVSGAIVYAIKISHYPVAYIKAAGYSDDLIAAIDGLTAGSTPEINNNTRTWGEKVKAYLRS